MKIKIKWRSVTVGFLSPMFKGDANPSFCFRLIWVWCVSEPRSRLVPLVTGDRLVWFPLLLFYPSSLPLGGGQPRAAPATPAGAAPGTPGVIVATAPATPGVAGGNRFLMSQQRQPTTPPVFFSGTLFHRLLVDGVT